MQVNRNGTGGDGEISHQDRHDLLRSSAQSFGPGADRFAHHDAYRDSYDADMEIEQDRHCGVENASR